MERTSMGGQVDTWVHQHFAGQSCITREQLMAEAAHSDLPSEAKEAIAQLPGGEWNADRAVHRIVDELETRSGGGARGTGNLPGAGGYGRSR
jgi:hypothetical protein